MPLNILLLTNADSRGLNFYSDVCGHPSAGLDSVTLLAAPAETLGADLIIHLRPHDEVLNLPESSDLPPSQRLDEVVRDSPRGPSDARMQIRIPDSLLYPFLTGTDTKCKRHAEQHWLIGLETA